MIANEADNGVPDFSLTFAVFLTGSVGLVRHAQVGAGLDLDFTNATFDGGDFIFAEFSGGKVSFYCAKFTGGKVSFCRAKFAGGEVSFAAAEYTPGCSINWGTLEPPAAWTALQENERRQNEPPL